MLIEQQLGNGRAVLGVCTGGIVQRCPARMVHACAQRQQLLDHIDMPFDAGMHQRRLPRWAGSIDMDTGCFDQLLRHPQ